MQSAAVKLLKTVCTLNSEAESCPNLYIRYGKTATAVVRVTGVEPAREAHRNLNPARLPIPPYPHSDIISHHSNVVNENVSPPKRKTSGRRGNTLSVKLMP